MPTRDQVQRQMQFDLATKQALRERDDDETRPHIVGHHFVAADQSALIAVDKIGRMLGFDAGEIKQGENQSGAWYCISIY